MGTRQYVQLRCQGLVHRKPHQHPADDQGSFDRHQNKLMDATTHQSHSPLLSALGHRLGQCGHVGKQQGCVLRIGNRLHRKLCVQ